MARTFKPWKIKTNFCPLCFCRLDAATNVTSEGEGMPTPGDFTVCIGCGGILKWDADMVLLPSKLEDIPVQIRASFARVSMLIKERINGKLGGWV